MRGRKLAASCAPFAVLGAQKLGRCPLRGFYGVCLGALGEVVEALHAALRRVNNKAKGARHTVGSPRPPAVVRGLRIVVGPAPLAPRSSENACRMRDLLMTASRGGRQRGDRGRLRSTTPWRSSGSGYGGRSRRGPGRSGRREESRYRFRQGVVRACGEQGAHPSPARPQGAECQGLPLKEAFVRAALSNYECVATDDIWHGRKPA